MSTIREIQIAVDDTSLAALKDLGYALYALRAVDTNNAGARALVWAAVADFLNQTTLALPSTLQAYVTTRGSVMDVSVGDEVVLGDVFTYVAGGAPTVTPGGNPRGVTVLNGTTDPLTAGLAAGSPTLFVSAPLYGLGGDIFAPKDSFLVTFSTAGLSPGAVLNTSMSQSLLIDMTGQAQVAASFDINKGWSYGGAPWGQVLSAGANLQKTLITTMPMAKSA
ncbi:hypothetical protein [Caulobacter soli]|uniref:hypothetical protein n=1 Tax=Caulobacter soli TaxID=2708539 RepID=UPI0013EB057F|nr:hypothetical protein [Caulobacter soli]